MTLDAIEKLEVGQLVDYIMEYNNMHDPEKNKKEAEKPKRRQAVQSDWDSLLG